MEKPTNEVQSQPLLAKGEASAKLPIVAQDSNIFSLSDWLLDYIFDFCELDRFGCFIAWTSRRLRERMLKRLDKIYLPQLELIAEYPNIYSFLERTTHIPPKRYTYTSNMGKKWLFSHDSLKTLIALQTLGYDIRNFTITDAVKNNAPRCLAFMMSRAFPLSDRVDAENEDSDSDTDSDDDGYPETGKLFMTAAALPSVECFDLLANNYTCHSNCLFAAAAISPERLEHVAHYCLDHHDELRIETEMFNVAAAAGKTDCLEWLREHKTPSQQIDYSRVFVKACRSGNVDCIRYVKTTTNPPLELSLKRKVSCLLAAANSKSEACFDYVMKELVMPVIKILPPDQCSRLAEIGDKISIQSLLAAGMPFTCDILLNALNSGNKELAMSYLDRGLPTQDQFEAMVRISPENFWPEFVDKLVAKGLRVTKELCHIFIKQSEQAIISFKHGCYCGMITVTHALKIDRPDCLVEAVKRGRKLTLEHWRGIISRNKPEYLRAMIEAKLPMRHDLCYIAITLDALKCFKFAVEQGYPRPPETHPLFKENPPALALLHSITKV